MALKTMQLRFTINFGIPSSHGWIDKLVEHNLFFIMPTMLSFRWFSLKKEKLTNFFTFRRTFSLPGEPQNSQAKRPVTKIKIIVLLPSMSEHKRALEASNK